MKTLPDIKRARDIRFEYEFLTQARCDLFHSCRKFPKIVNSDRHTYLRDALPREGEKYQLKCRAGLY